MGVLRLIKELQTELMASTELPHVVSTRLLARLDEAERHLGLPPIAFDSAQATVVVEQSVEIITEDNKGDSDEKN